ncbi:hypothetical protein [Nocardioides sp.]|uniref:hypothetical protein n=1 Tax=Nocardioides sp. TaxID=35761 RepID=UPI00239DB1F2|nr:hypothetical protein [Nocardioides sp.]MDE0776985.1 hypothetical protein [Nocardioides sp.]
MNSVTGLSLGRIGIGIASLVKPDLVQSTMGTTTTNPLLTQWFGSREIALGAATLLAGGGARSSLVLIGMAVDAADAATAYQAVEKELMPRNIGLAFAGVAAGAVLSGLLGLRVKKKVKLTKAEKKALADA